MYLDLPRSRGHSCESIVHSGSGGYPCTSAGAQADRKPTEVSLVKLFKKISVDNYMLLVPARLPNLLMWTLMKYMARTLEQRTDILDRRINVPAEETL